MRMQTDGLKKKGLRHKGGGDKWKNKTPETRKSSRRKYYKKGSKRNASDYLKRAHGKGREKKERLQ